MRLYTIYAEGHPVLTMNAGPDADMDLWMLGIDMQRSMDLREIDIAMDTWLGADLQAQGLWGGDHCTLEVRDATGDEANTWRRSHQMAIANDNEEADEDWVAYLIPVGYLI